MTDNTNSEDAIAKTFEDILWAIGKQIKSKFEEKGNKINMQDVMPDANGDVSDSIKPMMKVAKEMFKELLSKNLDATQLASLEPVFNKTFLDEISKSTSKKENTSMGIAIQLLLNIGIPMLKSLIGKEAKDKKHAEQKQQSAGNQLQGKPTGYYVAHTPSRADHAPGNAALHQGQQAQNVKGAYHRMAAGNRGSKTANK